MFLDGSYTKCLAPAYYHVSTGASVRLVQSYEPVDYNDQATYPGIAFPDGSTTEFYRYGLYHLSSDASVTMVAPPQQGYDSHFAAPGVVLPIEEEGNWVPESGVEYEDQHPGFQYAEPSMKTAPNQASHEAVARFFASRFQGGQLGKSPTPDNSHSS